MATKTQRIERRTDALSKARIVEAATLILDAEGEAALTFRALAARLATGAGAIYWHVADKDDLLTAATGDIISGVMAGVAGGDPREAIRALALGVFDAIDAHPWVGAHLARAPWQPAALDILEGVGGRLKALGAADATLFNTATALASYILGAAGQNAANARLAPPETDRPTALAAIAERWARLDPERYPVVRQLSAQMADHDDREQFLAGVDLILAGVTAPG